MTERSCTFRDKHNTLCCTECGSDVTICQCVNPDLAAQERWTTPPGLVMQMIRDKLNSEPMSSTHALATLVTEVGDLSRNMAQHDRAQGTPVHEVLRSAVATAAAAVHIAVHGDDNFLYSFPVVEDDLPRGSVGRTYD